MLTRFKEKNPTPLNNLHKLLSFAYQNIVKYSKRIEVSQKELITASELLSIGI